MQFMALPNIKVGIVSLEAGFLPLDVCSFTVYDNQFLSKSMANEDVPSKNATDIAEHLKVFGELDRLADYGDVALALTHKAASYFN
jgi:hypothetical protein